MAHYQELSDVEATRPDQANRNASRSGQHVSSSTNRFTPINQNIALSTDNLSQEDGTAVGDGSGRKRVRTAPTNMLVADYLGIGVDLINSKAKARVKQNHPLAALSKPRKRRRVGEKPNPDPAASVGKASQKSRMVPNSRVTDGIPVVKKPQQCANSVIVSDKTKNDEDDIGLQPESPRSESRKAVIASPTSIDAIKSYSHLGFTAYDSRSNDSRPVSSSSVDSVYQGHEVRRVISLKRSTSRNNEDDTTVDDTIVDDSAFMKCDTFDLDNNDFEKLADDQNLDPADLPEQPLDDETFTDTTNYATDFDSDDFNSMYQLADSGYMSSPQKGGPQPHQGLSPCTLRLSPKVQQDIPHEPATEQDTWSMSDEIMDEDLIELERKVEIDVREPSQTDHRALSDMKPTTATPTSVAQQEPMDADSARSQKGVRSSSNQLILHLPDSTSDSVQGDEIDGREPVVRKPFPDQIKDRSPVLGVSTNSILRSCFRVGEALNTGCHAVRNGKNVVLELYARVTSSSREPGTAKQHFTLADLFHDNLPYIEGTYTAWKTVQKWDEDSARFLDTTEEKSRVCRCVGSMSRDKAKWKMIIHSIREASWDEVEYTAGIYRDPPTDTQEEI